jgi:predicted CXXCH cytochrome family protein
MARKEKAVYDIKRNRAMRVPMVHFIFCFLLLSLSTFSILADPAPPTNKAPVDFTTCTTAKCHIEKRHKAFTHETMKTNDCGLCHKPVLGTHKFTRVNDPAQVCTTCHKEFAANRLTKLENGTQIRTKDAVYYTHPFDVKVSKELLEPTVVKDLEKFGMKFSQNKINCLTCHDSHQGDNRYFLRDLDADQAQTDFCIRCHKTDRATKHPFFSDGKTGKKAFACSKCHQVHRGTHPLLLTLSKSESANLKEICLSCHEKELAGHPHPSGKKGCLDCHSLHEKNLKEGTLIKKSKDGKQGVCFDCHAEKMALEKSPHDFSNWDKERKEEVAKVLSRRWPITMDCELCHQMHLGNQGSLLLETERHRKAPAIDRLCLACHKNRALSGIPQVTRYGMSAPLAFNFLGQAETDPKKSLPFFDKTGKRTTALDAVVELGCATCHDPHQHSKDSSQVKGGVRGKYLRDPQKILKYCSACHGLQTLVIYPLFHTSRHRKSEGD